MIAVVSSWWGVAGAGAALIGMGWLGVRVGEARERQHAEQRAALIDDAVAREATNRYGL